MKSLLLLSLLLTISFAEQPYDENQISNMKENQKKAEFHWALKYALGIDVEKNEKKAFHLFHRAARKGHLEATYLMGVCFEQGRGVKRQKNLARYWFKLAANKGHSKAKFRLAIIEQNLKINKNRALSRFVRR